MGQRFDAESTQNQDLTGLSNCKMLYPNNLEPNEQGEGKFLPAGK